MIQRGFAAALFCVALGFLCVPAQAKPVTPGKIFGDFKRCIAAEVKGRTGCGAGKAAKIRKRPNPSPRAPKPAHAGKSRGPLPMGEGANAAIAPTIVKTETIKVEVKIVSLEERSRLPETVKPKLAKGDLLASRSEALLIPVRPPAVHGHLGTSSPLDLRALAARHASAAGVPVALALKVVAHESGWKPGVTGRAGEVGLMQIKLATARGIGYRGTRKELYQPDVNLRWGMKYLAGAHRLAGGDVCGTLSRYNAGHGFKGRRAAYCRKVLGR